MPVKRRLTARQTLQQAGHASPTKTELRRAQEWLRSQRAAHKGVSPAAYAKAFPAPPPTIRAARSGAPTRETSTTRRLDTMVRAVAADTGRDVIITRTEVANGTVWTLTIGVRAHPSLSTFASKRVARALVRALSSWNVGERRAGRITRAADVRYWTVIATRERVESMRLLTGSMTAIDRKADAQGRVLVAHESHQFADPATSLVVTNGYLEEVQRGADPSAVVESVALIVRHYR